MSKAATKTKPAPPPPDATDDDAGEGMTNPATAAPTPMPPRRIRITEYKVRTSAGRALAGDYLWLPDDEASVLIAERRAVDAPVEARV